MTAAGGSSAWAANGGQPHQAESWQLYEIDRVRPIRQRSSGCSHDIESTLDRCAASRSTTGRAMRERVRSLVAELGARPAAAAVRGGQRGAPTARMDGGAPFRLPRLPALPPRARRQRGSPGCRTRAAGSGILRARGVGGRRRRDRADAATCARAPASAELLVLTKANSISTVHRGEYLDYAGVKTFDARGRVTGEHRFLGLWTSTAYHRSPRDIPVLRRKVDRVIEYFGLDPHGHDGKAVLNVLETYPRDELFQAGVEDLIRIARGVVNLYERRTVRLLVRRDPYHRFYSCLVYVPRDRYNTEVRQRIEQIVLEGFAGRVRGEPGADLRLEPRARARGGAHGAAGAAQGRYSPTIERRIAEAALTWTDRLREVLVRARRRGCGHCARDTLPARLSARLRGGCRTRRRAGRHRRSRGAAHAAARRCG